MTRDHAAWVLRSPHELRTGEPISHARILNAIRDRVLRGVTPTSFREVLGLALGLGAVGYLVLIALGVVTYGATEALGGDAHAYWAASLDHPYSAAVVGQADAYLYSPVFLQVLAPLKLLPWPVFFALWTAIPILALFYLRAPYLLLFPPLFNDLVMGNVHLLMAGAIVLGFRYPAAWSFILLTKVTPGVGLAWFAFRREWRSLAIAVVATLAVATVSYAINPGAWGEWIATLADNSGTRHANAGIELPLLARLPVGLALVAWGAVTNRRWTVLVAATLALPVLWASGLTILLGILALRNARGPKGSTGRSAQASLEPA